ncbi:MAG: LacI family DNA-binding transcriptional regulator [Lachnospiraceae bacterium]|nr:LacI family DNA-binding transcriptional regulator [Lachnospiraceae bacterium]
MNINEIAKMANVSRATVSRYLNNGYVGNDKKEAVRKVIEKTGYKPSTQARKLRLQKTGIIGLVIPKTQSESVSRMVSGISSVLADKDYQLLLANTMGNPKEEIKYLKTFNKSQVDGILFMGTTFTKEHMHQLKNLEVPIVIIGQRLDGYPSVYQDDYHAAREISRKLLQSSRMPGYLGTKEDDVAVGRDRKRGFLEAVEEAGLTITQEQMKIAEMGIRSGYEKAAELLSKVPETDALFCATDNIAIGALKYLHEQKISVPEQVQIIGFGDTEVASVVTPALTTVHYYYQETGAEAARLLLEILENGVNLRKTVEMGYELAEHDSTRAI